MARDILLFTKDTCCFQVKCSSSKMPRHFVEVSLQPVPIMHNGTSFITSCLSVRSQDLCLGLTTIYLVFLAFNDSTEPCMHFVYVIVNGMIQIVQVWTRHT